MKTSKEINRLISNIAGDAEVYDIKSEVKYLPRIIPGEQPVYNTIYIKNIEYNDYASDVSLALDAAKRIADKNNYTFVLTYLPEESRWKASFSDYRDCAEYSGFNPAYTICMSILEFMGKL